MDNTRKGFKLTPTDKDKRIEELEKEIEELKKTYRKQRNKRIDELQKENAELRTKVTALENANRAMVKELDDTTSGGLSVLEKSRKVVKELDER